MKKGIISKTLRKKGARRKQGQTARTLERKIKSSLSRSAQKLSDELQSVEKQLASLPDHQSCHWLWLADIRRAGHLMEQVLEVLEDARSTPAPAAPVAGGLSVVSPNLPANEAA